MLIIQIGLSFNILFSDTYVAKPSSTLSNPRRQALQWAKEPVDQTVKAYVIKVKPALQPVFCMVSHDRPRRRLHQKKLDDNFSLGTVDHS